MINKLIEKQLNNLKVARYSCYDEVKHQFVFNKVKAVKLEEDKFYLVKLDVSLLTDDALMYTLNKGNLPKYNSMKINVLKIVGNRAFVSGVYSSVSGVWTGWLLLDKIEVLEEI